MTTRTDDAVVFEPVPEVAAASQLAEFRTHCESETGLTFADHAEFHRFSVEDFRTFWRLFLDWSGLLVEGDRDSVCVGDDVESAEFFPGLRLSYVENLLREIPGQEDLPAVIARHATRPTVRMSRAELRDQVLAVAGGLREQGLGAGDHVVAVSANIEQLVVTGLAVMGLGATLSSTAPDLGTPAVLSRFQQLQPSLLLYGVSDSQMLSTQAARTRLRDLAAGLPSLRGVVVLDELAVTEPLDVEVLRFTELRDATPLAGWERFAFDHPLWVLFSSGTTGAPKCIVHTAGGALVEHVKEHVLHGDLRPDDVLFFQTSPAWMMWNWLLSGLATGATIVLNDGPVSDPGSLWGVVADEAVTVFGTGPAYLQFCESSGYHPADRHDLGTLRTVMSTGSVLYDHQFDWVREHVGALPLQSISGGTDIVGCFLLGNPMLPVRRGELQCPSLALDVHAAATDPVTGVGELTCSNPFPSRPAGLLGDADGSRFHEAYFAENPGVWTHGDLVELTETGSARIHGRSDGVMNINGVRIAPAELYTLLADLPDVAAAMAVEQRTPDGPEQSRMVLLVVMAHGLELDHTLEVRIRQVIGRGASPLHVPGVVVQVPDLPRTHSGKDSERAARDILDGLDVVNRVALRNPDSLNAIASAVTEADAHQRRRRVALDLLLGGEGHLAADLAAIFSLVLDAPAGPDDNFFDLGGTSLAVAQLCREIHESLGHDLPITSLYAAPTARELAVVITADVPGPERNLVILRAGDPELRPIFVTFDISGDVACFLQLVERLPGRRPVYGIRARGLDGSTEPDQTVEDMAEAAIDSVRLVQPGGTYTLMGYSFGGLVAYEMASRLVASGMRTDQVVLLDSYVGTQCLSRLAWWRHVLLQRPLRWARWLLQSPSEKLRHLWRRFARTGSSQGATGMGPERTPLHGAFRAIGLRELDRYVPAAFDGDLVFVRSPQRLPNKCDPVSVWRSMVGHARFSVLPAAGDHSEMMSPPFVDELVVQLAPLLADEEPPVGRAVRRIA